jgi:hypothetical protein
MIKYYVYLHKSENRLLITRTKKDSKNEILFYKNLLFVFGNNAYTLRRICDAFCLGYMSGSLSSTPVNDVDEFDSSSVGE